ncbi:MAG: class I SAM-dependent methyltransferase [Bradyrhizobium sp.]|uniref:class I SAM-dependent methyltransferase n=1 Tax=Bradyrhizobium sp. TaxID=376 RepID=UPI0012056D34|nr:class I SAM-dependent methyltransferase [Bradyrhizobium sp.]THD66223.1 MAG: class I SAM-dependent methyltransferase [Bradyrhizobium sp.]
MRSVMISICVAFVLAIGSARLGGLLAQTTPEPQTHYKHGQGYQHSFENAEKWAKAFDDPARDAWQKPDEVLDALHLQRTDRVADLGAGTGYFSARIAKLVPEGKLFSVDIEPEMLRHLRERARHENLGVLVPILASTESANLPEPVDLILVVDTYHHIDNRVAYFSKLKASLRPNGRLAIVDFKADSPEGPPPEHRIPPEKITSELDTAGYTIVATHPFLARQYFLVFQAKTS